MRLTGVCFVAGAWSFSAILAAGSLACCASSAMIPCIPSTAAWEGGDETEQDIEGTV